MFCGQNGYVFFFFRTAQLWTAVACFDKLAGCIKPFTPASLLYSVKGREHCNSVLFRSLSFQVFVAKSVRFPEYPLKGANCVIFSGGRRSRCKGFQGILHGPPVRPRPGFLTEFLGIAATISFPLWFPSLSGAPAGAFAPRQRFVEPEWLLTRGVLKIGMPSWMVKKKRKQQHKDTTYFEGSAVLRNTHESNLNNSGIHHLSSGGRALSDRITNQWQLAPFYVGKG